MSGPTGERSPRWTVHIEWIDGAIDEVVGDPTVVGDVLVVAVRTGTETEFEAQYPLRHVRVWWCDYTGGDAARANARGRRTRVGATVAEVTR